MKDTPGLDRLTAGTGNAFWRHLGQRRSGNQMVELLKTAPVEAVDALGLGTDEQHAATLVRGLYRLGKRYFVRDAEGRARAMREFASETAIPEDLTASLVDLIEDIDGYLFGEAHRVLGAYSDAEVCTVLLDLYHIGYEEFDPDGQNGELEYNADDNLPNDCETPHNHLADLAATAASVRVLKRSGHELVLALCRAAKTT